MRPEIFIKVEIAVLALAVLLGCSPTPEPVSNEPVLIPCTATPVPGAIPTGTTESVVLLRTFSGHRGKVLEVAFSPRGETLVSSSQDMHIRLWDVASGRELHAVRMRSVDMAYIDISPVGDLLASGEAIWDLESMQEIHILERGSIFPAFVAFSPDGSMLALALFEQAITFWDVASGEPVYTFEQQEEKRTKWIDFSPDGTLLAVGVADGSVRVLDVASGEIVAVLRYAGETDIHDLTFSPAGRYLASGGRISKVVLWDVATGEVVRTFRLTDNLVSLDFSPDGRLLAATGGYRYDVRVFDVESGGLLYTLPHEDQLMSVAFSPDGRLLAVGCYDGNIYLWAIPPDD